MNDLQSQPKSILMHCNPDWDSMGAAWLLAKFYTPLHGANLCFVAASDNENPLLKSATAVVDVGLIIDPSTLRFDHHQENLGKTTSACKQVYDFLLSSPHCSKPDISYLEQLVNLIFFADTGKKTPEVEFSYLLGMHALLSSEKYRLNGKNKPTDWDLAVAEWGFNTLDSLERSLRKNSEGFLKLDGCTRYLSEDKRFRAIDEPCIDAAFASGTDILLYKGEPKDIPKFGKTYPIMISRSHTCEDPHVGELVDVVLSEVHGQLSPKIKEELMRWWKHPAGFFAGRGGPKAPLGIPLEIKLEEVAVVFDKNWIR